MTGSRRFAIPIGILAAALLIILFVIAIGANEIIGRVGGLDRIRRS